MKTTFTTLFILLFVAVLASACGAPAASQGEAVSALSQDEATAVVENALQGLKDGNYAVWSRDWSDAMKSAIPQSAFLDFRKQFTAQYGQLVTIESVSMEPGKNKGYVRWAAICDFEKGKVKFNFGFRNDGKLIEGVSPEALK